MPTAVASAGGAPLALLDVVKTTLRLHPGIAAARAQLAERSAEADAARAPFDGRFTSRLGHEHAVSPRLPAERLAGERAVITDSTNLSVGASLATQWGTRIQPSVGLTRLHARMQDPTLPVPGSDPAQYARVGLNVVQPLLRGAGTVGAASAIEAGRLFRGAAVHLVAQTAQEQVSLALGAYFQLIAQNQQLGLLEATRAGAQKLVDETKVLVASDQRPRSDLRQLEASLANRVRAVTEAENRRVQAVYDLGLAMGLDARQTLDFRPSDGFPKRLPALDREGAVRAAQQSRSDVQAARTTLAAAAAGLEGAEHNTAPALDLGASVGYAGALDLDGADAFFASSVRNVRGVNAGVSLSLELPFSNTAANAERDVRRAQYDQARIAAADLDRTLPIAVTQASEDLRLSSSALTAASEAVTAYEQVVADQRDKVRAGVGTVIELILTEELLISAQQNQIENQLRCALAFTRLLFETGALPSREADVARVAARLTAAGATNAGQ
jgi:outer membrane protein TolC